MIKDSVDKILQGNTGNIIYLKSTDDSMLETLEKIAGVRHESYRDSKTTTRDVKNIGLNKNDSKVSYTTAVREVPTISKNDMLFIKPDNAMVFGKGNPLWSKNQTVMPMSWRLHMHQLSEPGVDYTLLTVPSISDTTQFDIRGNQPNFDKMVDKRVEQARLASEIRENYREAYGTKDESTNKVTPLSDDAMARLDPEILAQEIMEGINDSRNKKIDDKLKQQKSRDEAEQDADLQENQEFLGEEEDASEFFYGADSPLPSEVSEKNGDFYKEKADAENQLKQKTQKIYANGQLSRNDIYDNGDVHLDRQILSEAYHNCINDFKHDNKFVVDDNNNLYSADSNVLYMKNVADDFDKINNAATDDDNDNIKLTDPLTLSDGELANGSAFEPQIDFYKYLISLDNWNDVAGGAFDSRVSTAFDQSK